MGRKRIKKKRRTPKDWPDESKLVFVSYDVVYDPIKDEHEKDLGPELAKQKEELYYSIREKPEEAAPRIVALIEKYPDVPSLYNYLSVAYRLMRDSKRARDIILETYRKFPDYLFAKLAYVELCLDDDDLDEIPRILDNKFDLKLHYPERTKFHISEFTSFAGTMGLYFCRIEKPDTARQYLEMLEQVAPEDPQTKRLEKALKASETLAALKKLRRFFEK